jgi:DedD protein
LSSQFHNRLVGTIVIVALGVIFLPDLLDGKKEREEEQFSEIPLRPVTAPMQQVDGDFEVLEAPVLAMTEASQIADEAGQRKAGTAATPTEPELKAKVQPQTQPQAQTSPTTKPVTNPAPTPTAVAVTKPSQKVPETKVSVQAKIEPKAQPKAVPANAFTLQLGSFNNITNVRALVAQLRKAGFTTYTLPNNPVEGRMTKVFVGPDVSEAKLLRISQQVEKLTRLKGRVVAYHPLDS